MLAAFFSSNFPEAPFRENAFAGGNGQVSAPRNVGHHIHVLRLAGLFYKHGLVGLQLLDEHLGRLGGDVAVKVDGNVHVGATGFAQGGKIIDGVLDELGVLDNVGRVLMGNARFNNRVAFGLSFLHVLGIAGPAVYPNPVAGGAAQQFVDGHVQQFAFDVPQGVVNAAQRTGQDGATPVKSVAVNGLPVVDYRPWVFPDQVRLHFLDGGLDGQRPPFEQRFAEAVHAHVGVNLQENPARFNQKGFQFGDFYLAVIPEREPGLAAYDVPGRVMVLMPATPSTDWIAERRDILFDFIRVWSLRFVVCSLMLMQGYSL